MKKELKWRHEIRPQNWSENVAMGEKFIYFKSELKVHGWWNIILSYLSIYTYIIHIYGSHEELSSLLLFFFWQNSLLGPRTIRIFHTWSLIIYFEELSPSTFIFFIFVLCSLRMSNWRWCCLLLSCKSISQPIIYCELDRFELNFTVDCELYQAFDANCLFLTAGLDIFFVQMCFYNSTEDDSIFNLAFWVNKGWK